MLSKIYIIQNIAIILVCIFFGTIVRIIIMRYGHDAYTGNIFFWLVTIVLYIMYLTIIIFLNELSKEVQLPRANKKIEAAAASPEINKNSEPALINRDAKKKQYFDGDMSQSNDKENKKEALPNKDEEVEMHIEESDEALKSPSNGVSIKTEIAPNQGEAIEVSIGQSKFQNTENLKGNTNISTHIYNADNEYEFNLSEIEEIRLLTKKKNENILKDKFDFVNSYTQKKLADYMTNDDLHKFCNSLLKFLKNGTIENETTVQVVTIKGLDLMHFGWNVWNYHKGTNQRKDLSKFLKIIFPTSFKGMEESTIQKLLTSRKNEGIIKIEKNLLQ